MRGDTVAEPGQARAAPDDCAADAVVIDAHAQRPVLAEGTNGDLRRRRMAVAAAPGSTAPPPRPPNSSFTARVDNPWFPLIPGSRWIYHGIDEGRPSREVVTVPHRTATIDGVKCAVVEDRLYVNGRLSERTTDWYTQDKQGNVWYFGENTATIDASGKVRSTEGSWRAGVNGARPGLFMRLRPRRRSRVTEPHRAALRYLPRS